MSSGLRGQRIVVGLYLIIVGFTAVAGYMTATVVGEIDPPRFLFLIEFPPTPLGLAAFGALTIGLILGMLLVAVTVISERFDDASPGDADTDDSSDREHDGATAPEPAGGETDDEADTEPTSDEIDIETDDEGNRQTGDDK